MKLGIFDHLSLRLGGGQLVVAQMAAQLSHSYEVELIHCGKGYTLSTLGKAFEVDLSRVKERIVNDWYDSFAIPGQQSTWISLRDGVKANRELTKPYDLFIYSGHGVPPFSFARRGLIYCHFPFEGSPETLRSVERFKQKRLVSRWLHMTAYEALWNLRMRRYETILANSFFTARWIKEMWRKQAEVLYPAVSLQVPRADKRNAIVSIGRFIDTNNNKNHVQQLKAFEDFLRQVGPGWRLYLIGFCSSIPREVAYVEGLREIAKGWPVTFVVNAKRAEVLRLLAEAKLFWHTAGLMDSGETAPPNMEHFGIATVEAMLSGCVPLTPAHGGQVEIVDHGVNGFLCHNTKELVEHSVRLASDERLLEQMGRRAVIRGHMFDQSTFEQRMAEVVNRSLSRRSTRIDGSQRRYMNVGTDAPMGS